MGAPRKLLLLDDSEITLVMESAALQARGYEVRTAATLAAFSELLRTYRPDLILTDIHMPEITGGEVCRHLKAQFATQDIPIVLFSSLTEAELAPLAAEVGADGYLSKAEGMAALGAKIDELVDSILW